ncbi:PIN domain-containing protein [Priestia megaterium]|uniref:tetratricopeptide repeat protein n=1 Tax=Priestia megaterium TaxID=1404 RepID=UPI002E22B1E1|nr:hypothetical protein [Priestia megaterium]
MGMSTLAIILKGAGTQFFSFMFPRIKNSKFFRDIKKKWLKDNYALKTKLIFEGAVVDSKAAFDLPDDLIGDLLGDKINREEIFRWILEGTSIEQFDLTRLNLEPYMESYPQYQDFLRPFFEMVLLNLHDYKEANWEPEFLELIHKIDQLEEITRTGFLNVEEKQTKTIQLIEENTLLLKEVVTPVEFEDLNELVKLEKISSAREKAKERLKNAHLKRNEILELNSIISNTYITSGQEKKAIKYLYTCINYCDEYARKKRLYALINLIEKRLDEALGNIQEAIKIEGYNKKNIEILINIYIQQKKYDSALGVLQDHSNEELPKLKTHILLSLKKFSEAMDLIDFQLQIDPENIDWLLIKAESSILKVEQDIEKNITVDPLKSFKEVMPLLEKLEKKNIDNIGISIRIKEMKAALYFRNKNYAESKLLYEEIYRSNIEISTLYFKNLLLSCYGDQDWEKAILLLEEIVMVDNPNLDDIIELAKMYVEAGRPEDGINLLEQYRTHLDIRDKVPMDYYLTYLDALLLNLKHHEINEMITRIEKETADSTSILVLKGYYAIKLHDWGEAITQFESCIDLLEESELLEVKLLLSHAYSNSATKENYKKLKELLVTIPNWTQHDFLINRYTDALFELGEYESVISLIEQVPEKTIFLLDRITTIYFNLGWHELAKINYRTLYQNTKELGYQLRYASCLYRLGNIEECLEVLTSAEVRVKKSGRTEDFSLLSVAFINAMQYRKALGYAYQTYIVGKEEPESWRFFFSVMSQIGRFVENPEAAWVRDFQSMINRFSEKFPEDEPIAKQVLAIEDDGSISSEFLDEVKKGSDFSQEMKRLFKMHRFSTSLLATFMNRGPFATWGHVMNEKDMDLWITNGDRQELIEGQFYALQSKKVICDVTTLLTLRYLGLLDKLAKYYKLYIHQRHFDAIFHEYSQTKLISDQGLKTIVYHEGKVVMQEFSSEQVKESLRNQEEFIEWVNKNCKKIGSTISNEHKIELEHEELAFFFEPMEVCKSNSYSMLVDSSTTRAYAKANYEVDCFTSLDLLNLLFSMERIDKEKQSELIGKLMMTGHSLIPINKDVFIFYLRKNNYKINSEMSLLFDYLKKQEFNKPFLINLCADLLAWIWIENISLYERQQLTDHICSVLTIGNKKFEIISTLVRESKSKFSILVEHQWEQMKICIEQWFQAQSIV